MNAIDFIKRSLFYTSGKYSRIRAIVDKVLSDQLTERDLDIFVDAIGPLETSMCVAPSDAPAFQAPTPVPMAHPSEFAAIGIKVIRKIHETRNIAMINQAPPIELTEGLNIFYGYNGSGKTSLYKALSNCLGLSDHFLDNVSLDIPQQPQTRLVVEDTAGHTHDLTWPTDSPVCLNPVKSFDPSICLALVQDDQDTTFSLVHLRQECFPLVGEALNSLATKVDDRKRVISDRLRVCADTIAKTIPLLCAMLPTLTDTRVEDASISEDERKILKKREAELESIEKDELPVKVKTLANDIAHLDRILSSMGQCTTDLNGATSNWVLTCTKSYIEKMADLVMVFNRDSALLEERSSTLRRFVKDAWLGNPLWRKFITSASDFVRSLEFSEQTTYREHSCPYCQQALSSGSQQLLAAYRDSLGYDKNQPGATGAEIVRALSDIDERIKKVKLISYEENLISEEANCLKGGEAFQLSHILNTFNQLTLDLATKSPIVVAAQEIENIEIAFRHYETWRRAVVIQKDSYERTVRNKDEEAQKLRLEMKPLKERQLLVDNRVVLREYLSLREKLAKLQDVRDSLTEAKRQASVLATEFSGQMTIQEFKRVLDQEYDSLGFLKPQKFTLACRSAAGCTKRVYTVADKRFRSILSEGEQKQHALADFFAQMELDGYVGPVILDDPVTSLDEHNTERVARRIVDLSLEQGNQVIVFTHNVFFLNALIEITHNNKVIQFSKTANEITIHTGVDLGSDGALNRVKKQIEERVDALMQDAQPGELTLRIIYDLLSNYIETAVEISLLKGVVGRYRPNIRIQSLPRVRWNESIVSKLVELYNRTSRKGTRHSQPPSVPPPTREECLTDAREILGLGTLTKP